MRKVLLSALFVAIVCSVSAQKTKTKEATKKVTVTKKVTNKKTVVKGIWTKGGNVSLAVTQGGGRNWAPGGDRFTLATNGFLNLYAKFKKERTHFDFWGDFNYGLMNSNAYGIIKNDDKLEVNFKWSHELGKTQDRKWRYGLLVNFRTQFTDGYDFDNVAEGSKPKRISSFLAPGIAVLSPGFDYAVCKDLNVHASPLAGRWILVPNRSYELAANYGVKPNQEVKDEYGFFVSAGYQKEICKNVFYQTRVDAFSNYADKTPGNIDVYWTNMIKFKINKCLAAVYSFDAQYDDDTKIFGYDKTRPGTQLKSIFGVGLNYKF